jgi:hypothetical protein
MSLECASGDRNVYRATVCIRGTLECVRLIQHWRAAMYNGVELFGEFADNASTRKIPQWQIKVRIALNKKSPESERFISCSSQDLQTELGHAVNSACSVEAAQQVRLHHEEAELDAAGHLLLFLAEPLGS